MNPPWWDPLGLRGSRLDPVAVFADALKGEGLAKQATEQLATTMARQLEGRRVAVDSEPPIAARIERVDEVTPAIALASVPSVSGTVPMWRRIRGVIGDVAYGDHRFETIEIDATGLAMRGPSSTLAIDEAVFVARIETPQLQTWIDQLGGDYELRLDRDRIEVSDRRVSAWGWLEVDASMDGAEITIEPRQLEVRGRRVRVPSRLQRSVVRHIDGLPSGLVIETVQPVGGALEVRGRLGPISLPVDIAGLLTELGAESGRSALRVAMVTA